MGGILIWFMLLTACGSVETRTTLPPPPPPPPTSATSKKLPVAVVLGADFDKGGSPIGALSLLSLQEPYAVAKNLVTTHSDAVIRSFADKLYVVNRKGGDNIQVVDPQDFRVMQQFSVGKGTNPHQIIVINPTKAYVTLYEPEDNRSKDLDVDDLLVVNPSNGKIIKAIDLTVSTTNDGDRFARASAMVLIGQRLFVALQDLPMNLSLRPNQSGKLVVIDISTDQIIKTIELQGRNPVSMSYAAGARFTSPLLYIAMADYFDIGSPYGGIEAVDPLTLESKGLFIDDLDLGGAVSEIDQKEDEGYVTAGYYNEAKKTYATRVMSFPLDIQKTKVEIVYEGEGFIQDIAVDPEGNLLVGDRDPKKNGIIILNPVTGKTIVGPINMGPAPSSITFIER